MPSGSPVTPTIAVTVHKTEYENTRMNKRSSLRYATRNSKTITVLITSNAEIK